MLLTKLCRYGLALSTASTILMGFPILGEAQDQTLRTTREVVDPDPPEASHVPLRALTRVEREQMLRRVQERREAIASQARPEPEKNDSALPDETVPATDIGRSSLRVPGTLVIGRNAKNTRAELAGNSTLAEPAAANWYGKVVYAGNFSHLERSTNHGVSYTNIAIPGGPTDAPTACCDNDIVIDNSGVAYHSLLYLNAAQTNGVVRIFVRRQANNFATSCSYTHDPAGANNNIVPDYPHIRLSKNYLYLTYNATGTGGGFVRIRRYTLSQMRNCQSVSVRSFTKNWTNIGGQRVWTPAEGAYDQTRMMWIHHETSSRVRIYEWLESSTSITSTTRNVQSSSFTNPDCRGGTGNFDFIERSTSYSIAGFRTRCTMAVGSNQPSGGVLACYWHSAPIGSQPNGHIRAAHFSITSKNVLSQPHIWSRNYCYGYPAVSSNLRGAIGYSLAYGGKNGGGGPAVQGAVGMFDTFGRNLKKSATGVAMRNDHRFGDYFTIHHYRGCRYWFGATSYAWDSSPVDNPNDVNARWVEFGREADQTCWQNGQ